MALGTPTAVAGTASADNTTSYALTGTVTAAVGDTILVCVGHYSGSGQITQRAYVTDSVGSLRWVRVVRQQATAANTPGVILFAAQPRAAFSGTITVNFDGTQRGCIAAALVWSGLSRAMPFRLDNSQSYAQGATTSAIAWLHKGFSSTGNALLVVVAHQANEGTAPGAGFTEPFDQSVDDPGNSTACGLSVQWKLNTTVDTTSWVTGATAAWLAIEVQEPAYLALEDVQLPQPLWLVEINTTNRYATYDLAKLTNKYDGRLLNAPTITKRLVDVRWGVVEVQNVTIDLANTDAAFNATYLAGMQGQSLVIKRYDVTTGYLATEWTGIVARAALSRGRLTLDGTTLDRSILETPLPDTVVEVAGFANAVDVGATIPVLFGSVAKLPMPYINDDPVNSCFDYVVGHGRLQVTGLNRNVPGSTVDRLVPIAFSECRRASDGNAATTWAEVARYDLYPGYTAVRFILRQGIDGNAGSSLHTIYVDATGPSRNHARAARMLLANTVYGLGKTTDDTTFTAAEAALSSLGASHYLYVLSLGPAIYYRCDEAAGNLSDATGGGRALVTHGSPQYQQPTAPIGGPNQGWGVAFVGNSADYFSLAAASASVLNDGNAGSWSCWYKPATLTGLSGVFEKTIGGVANTCFSFLQHSDGQMYWRVIKGAAGVDLTVPLAASDVGMWHHFAGLYNGGVMKLWMDGVLVGYRTYTAGVIDTGVGDLLVGKLGTGIVGSAYPCNGSVDELVFFTSVVLTDAQAAALYAQGGLLADGALAEQRQAQDWLREALMVRGLRLGLNASGAWTCTVDTPTNAIRLQASDALRTLVDVRERAMVPLEDRIKQRVLKYREDWISKRMLLRARRVVNTTVGRNKPTFARLVRDSTSADMVADYLAGVDKDSEEPVQVVLTQAARALGAGDLIELTESGLSFSGDLLTASEVNEDLEQVTATLYHKSWETYLYTPGTLPSDPLAGTATDFWRTAPTAASTPTLSTSGTRTAGDNHLTAWVTIAFTNPTSNLSAARVRYRVNGTTPWSVATVTAVTGATTATIEGLLPNVAYDFSVQTVNLPGNLTTDSGNLLNQTIANPSIATPSAGPIVTSPKPGQFVIVDQATRGANVKGMRVYRNTANSMVTPTPTDLGEIGGTIWIDNTGSYATQYWFAVKHVDGGKNLSAFSATGTSGAGGAPKIDTADIKTAAVVTDSLAVAAVGVNVTTAVTSFTNITSTSFVDVSGLSVSPTIASTDSIVVVLYSGVWNIANTDGGESNNLALSVVLTDAANNIIEQMGYALTAATADAVGPSESHDVTISGVHVFTGISGSQTWKIRALVGTSNRGSFGGVQHNLVALEIKR